MAAVGLVGLNSRPPAVDDRALAASSFSDLGGHWAQPFIQALADRRTNPPYTQKMRPAVRGSSITPIVATIKSGLTGRLTGRESRLTSFPKH
jgi:hypothetical protein